MYLEIVDMQQAVKLKTAGFDWRTELFYDETGKLRNYDTGLPAPTQALALQWLMEKNEEYISGITPLHYSEGRRYYMPVIIHPDGQRVNGEHSTEYTMAESKLIDAYLRIRQ